MPEDKKPVVPPADYKFQPAEDSRPSEYDEILNSLPNSVSTPLSELFHPDDDQCPICGKKMPALIGGIVIKNPQGYITCRECMRKLVPE